MLSRDRRRRNPSCPGDRIFGSLSSAVAFVRSSGRTCPSRNRTRQTASDGFGPSSGKGPECNLGSASRSRRPSAMQRHAQICMSCLCKVVNYAHVAIPLGPFAPLTAAATSLHRLDIVLACRRTAGACAPSADRCSACASAASRRVASSGRLGPNGNPPPRHLPRCRSHPELRESARLCGGQILPPLCGNRRTAHSCELCIGSGSGPSCATTELALAATGGQSRPGRESLRIKALPSQLVPFGYRLVGSKRMT